MSIFLVRYSEIGLKGPKARNDMEKRLVRNIKISHKMMNKEVKIRTERGRIFVYSEDSETSSRCISRVMGVKSLSEVMPIDFKDIEDIVKVVQNIYVEKVKGRTFAVTTRRTGKQNFTSVDVSKIVADSLYSESKGVDLKNPEVQISIEIRENKAYLITDTVSGPGGLPIGSEARMTALISGGIDSPVAAWMLLKRGSPVDMVFLSMAYPLDAVQFLNNAKSLYENWYFGYDPKIYIVDVGRLVDQYLSRGKMKFANVSFKKIMYKIAERIGMENGSYGIITGESSGQVSSQTPENLRELSRGMELPVHRPLLGFDKDEIIQLSRKIGTFGNDRFGEFCSLFGDVPITHITQEELQSDMDKLIDYFPSNKEIHIIRGSEISSFMKLIDRDYETSVIGDDDIVIDLRDRLSYKQWHFPNAINLTMDKVIDKVKDMEGERKIVLYCQKGLQSAHIASRLREMGYNAFYANIENVKNQIL
ncbi:THUMP domain-containing protein [Cuniculiplasma sp. SKW3]|uniref:tRNA sulfurtransferase n=1 Tax=Cuniculiplasma sp. SKW3 TaxID=3400170 RepID=UPI003FCEF2AD